MRLQAGTGDQSSEFIPVSPVLLSTAHSPGAELEAKYLPCQYTDTTRQTTHLPVRVANQMPEGAVSFLMPLQRLL